MVISFAGYFLNKFFFNQKIQLKRETSGNINILLLGRGGGTHDGPDLTDTMILLMINPTKNTADLISIPRDLWIPDLHAKINSAYATGQEKNQGILLTKAVVEKVTGQNIDYAVVIDFSGFVKLVDYIGGIDVDVARTLDDYAYPIDGKEKDTCGHTEEEMVDLSAQIATGSASESDLFTCRYKHLHVDQGRQHMNGELALEFSRSRHALGPEGTDFARSRRQQEVISAIKTKVLSLGIILNPVKVFGIFNILKSNIDTDIKIGEFDDFINLARKMQKATIESFVIDYGDSYQKRPGLLINPPPSVDKQFQFILTPRLGDSNFSEIHDYIACVSKGLICTITETGLITSTPTPAAQIKK